eukprot:COSAG05_NODE_1819_length_4019_cov_8.560714_2_plen_61_part_00
MEQCFAAAHTIEVETVGKCEGNCRQPEDMMRRQLATHGPHGPIKRSEGSPTAMYVVCAPM